MGPVIDGISGAVGGTPLVRLRRLLGESGPERGPQVLAKLESANPGGSAKDRPARRMVEDAVRRGLVRPGGTLIESSSGNLGVALAQQARFHGLRFICVVDPRTSPVSAALVRAYGGIVHPVTAPDPETGDWLVARKAEVQRLLGVIDGAYSCDQYANPLNVAAHAEGTMAEIVETAGPSLRAVVVATSTTGTLGGCLAYVRDRRLDIAVIAVDAEGSVLFGGVRGPRLLPGFGSGSATGLSANATPDRVVRVSDLDCVVGCRRLVRREALLAGASGGGVVRAVETIAGGYGPGDTIAAILHDGGERYLDTVYDDAWVASRLGCDAATVEGLVNLATPLAAA